MRKHACSVWLHQSATALALGLTLALTCVSAEAYTLVLKDGQRVAITAKPIWGFGQASVKRSDGNRRTIRHDAVNHEATMRANPELAAVRETAKVWTIRDLQQLPSSSEVAVLSSSIPAGNTVAPIPTRGVRTRNQARTPATKAAAEPVTNGAPALTERQLEHLRKVPVETYNSAARTQANRDAAARARGRSGGGQSVSAAARGTQANLAKSRAARQKGRTNARKAGAKSSDNLRKARSGR